MPTSEENALHYRLMFSENRAIMLLINPSDGRIVDASQGACQYYGYSLPELAAMNVSDINTMSKSEIETVMQRATECTKNHFHFCHRLASGEVRDVEVYSNPIPMEGQTFLHSVIHDITERIQAEEALRESEKRFSLFMDFLPAIVFIKDEESRTLYVNKYMNDVFGAKDWIGKTPLELFPKEMGEAMIADDNNALAKGHQKIIEAVPDRYGTNHIYQTHKFSIERSNKPPLLGGIALDITERKRTEEKLEYLATHDSLTELYNRKVLEQQLSDELLRAARYNHALSAFMLDVDHFKPINDTYGHKAGDTVLRGIAKILENSIRKIDYAARYGGEEFVIILPETPLAEAEELAERLCVQIAEHSIPIEDGKELNITASIGVSAFPEHGKSWGDLLKAADLAMYAAKAAGRNCVRVAKSTT